MNRTRILALLAPVLLILSACGVNAIPTAEETAKAKWADVQNYYQRRADLIPNLVETVRGFARQERDVLTQVTEARASASRITVTPEQLTDPAAMARFAQAGPGTLSCSAARKPIQSARASNFDPDFELDGTATIARAARLQWPRSMPIIPRSAPSRRAGRPSRLRQPASGPLPGRRGRPARSDGQFRQQPVAAGARVKGVAALVASLVLLGCDVPARPPATQANAEWPAQRPSDRPLPALTGRVVDGAGLLSPAGGTADRGSGALERRTTDQLSSSPCPRSEGRSIEDFGLSLGNHWASARTTRTMAC